ncbi:AbrB family transcriptional regulator [Streptomyces sp. DSM 42041]|uniref:AbrB family transcriptional regulator n=1 Tax=Streptomyces hazeniae TaxID=3075538 RepID=A0ABU2NMH5_9ACTN|nr:AbrB family transcriptional regulator [Streptomyces sp. DSM 42041]MDT0378177.1 AbrB family transcriptional regulator [Streptomyces sp. DSM 42041]
MSAGVVWLLLGGAAGAALAKPLRLPFWPLIGSIGGAAVVRLWSGGDVALPFAWQTAAQVLVGTVVGLAVAPGVLRDFRAVLLPGLLAVVAILGFGVGWGLLLGHTGATEAPAAVFGMVPGGVGEMLAAATAVHTDTAVVAAMHLVRLVVVLSCLPLLVRCAQAFGRWWEARGHRD